MKIKFFLQDKYERRRWYLEPGSEPPKRGGVAAGSNTPETKPLSHLLGSAAPKLVVGTRTDVREIQKSILSIDFLGVESGQHAARQSRHASSQSGYPQFAGSTGGAEKE